MAVLCPECDSPITIDTEEVEPGETIQCEECGTELEIISADPLEVAPVDEIAYDDEDHAIATDEEDE